MKNIIFLFSACILASSSLCAQICLPPAINYPAGSGPSSVTTADFNGDGKLDLASANSLGNNVSVLFGNGSGSFASATNYAVGTNPQSITAGDFNGDGFIDLITGNLNSPFLSFLRNTSQGYFLPALQIQSTMTWSIDSADFNGDGFLDIVTAGLLGASVLISDGAGNFSTPAYFQVGTDPRFVSCGDFNNDGNQDLATANYGSHNLSILLGDGTGDFSTANNYSLPVNSNPTCVINAVFNADGNLDLATTNEGSFNLSILIGDGTGVFSNTATIAYSWALPTSLTCNDFDGNGTLDLAILGGAMFTIFSGNGAGDFTLYLNINPLNSTLSSIISDDFDLNGKIDFAITRFYQPSAIAVLLNYGNFNINLSSTNIDCNGANDGSAVVTTNGGTAPFVYSWESLPMQTNPAVSGLPPGTYLVNVTDSRMCVRTAITTITQPSAISISTTSTDITCNPDNLGINDGHATADVSGGTPPYSYSWNSSPVQNEATATNLAEGNYTVTIIDSLNCIKTSSITINTPTAMSVYSLITDNTNCTGVCNGTVELSVVYGSHPLAYQWDASADNQTTANAYNLCNGLYNVTITDSNGCETTHEAFVNSTSTVDSQIYLTNLAAVDQTSVSPSFAAYYNYNLPTTINTHPSNPRNFVDPGRKARFKVECTNNKENGQSIVSGICKIRSNNPYIAITDSSSALNNIGWFNEAWSADEFEINIAPNTPPGTNAFIDFIVQESGQNYTTACIAIPITPLTYSPTTPYTIDDDSNPDSQGNDNDICEPNEIIEFYPLLDNVSTLDAEYVKGRFENLDNLSYINIWNNITGINTTVYDASWWNYGFAQPQIILSNSTETSPEYDFVFSYNNTTVVNDFNLFLVMAGGFNLFSNSALSLVQWSLPYTFNYTGINSVENYFDVNDDLLVYPNPSTDRITIKSKLGSLDKTYVIVNSIGEHVMTGKLSENATSLDISKLSSGLYLLQIGDKETHTFKLTKK